MRLHLALAAVALALIASAVPSQKASEIHASAGILGEHELQSMEQLTCSTRPNGFSNGRSVVTLAR